MQGARSTGDEPLVAPEVPALFLGHTGATPRDPPHPHRSSRSGPVPRLVVALVEVVEVVPSRHRPAVLAPGGRLEGIGGLRVDVSEGPIPFLPDGKGWGGGRRGG